MTTDLLFSIVIPTFNRVSTLRRAIKSAMDQTLPAEIVVVDDGSTDETAAYVGGLLRQVPTEACRYRIVYHRLARNSGHSTAMNEGIRLATGDWIKALDDDDYLTPSCIQQISHAISLHPQAVLCSGQAVQVDAWGHELGRTPIGGPGDVYFIPQEDIHYGMLLDQVPFGTPVQVAFAKAAALKAGGWDPSYDINYGDEADFWVRVASLGDAIFINGCVGYRTMWEGSYSHSYPTKARRDKNYLLKEGIYARISSTHRGRAPKLAIVGDYLNLHWGIISLRDGALKSGLSMLARGACSPEAWTMLMRARRFRKQRYRDPLVRRIPLNVLGG